MQKYAYHRLLVYSPKDYYYPFRVETFKLPSSCDCVTASFAHENYEVTKKHPHAPHHNSYHNNKVEVIGDYVKKKIEGPVYYPVNVKGHLKSGYGGSEAHSKTAKGFFPDAEDEDVPLYIDETRG